MKTTNPEMMWMPKFCWSLLVGVLGCLWICLPASAAIPIQQWVTENGAKVLFVETHGIPVVDISVEFDAGSRRDPAGKSGLSALVNSSLDKGVSSDNGNELTEAQILNAFADTGALHAGKASMDRAGYTLRILSGYTESEKAIQLMAQFLSSPSFPKKLLARDKTRFIASLKEEDTRPESIATKAFRRHLYADHPYGKSPDSESIASITRDDLSAFHKAHYVANCAVISIVGDIDRKRAEEIANEISRGLKTSDTDRDTLSAITVTSGKTDFIAHPATQAHVLLGMPALKRGDSDFFALTVGNYILGGGGFASRLMQEVRVKRGLSYSVYSGFHPMLQEGPFIIGLQTEKKQLGDALRVVNSTLDTFLREGPSEMELQSAKDHLVNSFAMKMDNNRKILELISMIGYYGLPLDYLDTWTEHIRQVSVTDVRVAMNRKLSKERMVTVVVGE